MHRRIDCEQICSRINQQLIAGRFGIDYLNYAANRSLDNLWFGSTLKSVAMSLYMDNMHVCIDILGTTDQCSTLALWHDALECMIEFMCVYIRT